MLVKQNVIDVFVVAAVLVVALAFRGQWRSAVQRAAAFVAGAIGALGVVLLLSAVRGTGPVSLWDALVTFRAQAAAVIHTSANVATPDRFHTMLVVLVLSGAPVVVVTALLGVRRPDAGPDLRWAALALLGVGAHRRGPRRELLAALPTGASSRGWCC